MTIRLIVRDRPRGSAAPPVRVFPLAEGATLVIGRSPAVDIKVRESSTRRVARRQCDIRFNNGGAQIIDYGGSSSTVQFAGQILLNGDPVGENLVWHDLRVGDEVPIGESELLVCRADEA